MLGFIEKKYLGKKLVITRARSYSHKVDSQMSAFFEMLMKRKVGAAEAHFHEEMQCIPAYSSTNPSRNPELK